VEQKRPIVPLNVGHRRSLPQIAFFHPPCFQRGDNAVERLETVMDWNAETETDRQALKRIAEMLVALAALADCSCSRSVLVRSLVLWFLRPAETVAWDFVAREAQASGVAMPDMPASIYAGDSVSDAMRLATLFRALALILQSLPVAFFQSARWRACRDGLPGHLAHSILPMLDRAAPKKSAGIRYLIGTSCLRYLARCPADFPNWLLSHRRKLA